MKEKKLSVTAQKGAILALFIAVPLIVGLYFLNQHLYYDTKLQEYYVDYFISPSKLETFPLEYQEILVDPELSMPYTKQDLGLCYPQLAMLHQFLPSEKQEAWEIFDYQEPTTVFFRMYNNFEDELKEQATNLVKQLTEMTPYEIIDSKKTKIRYDYFESATEKSLAQEGIVEVEFQPLDLTFGLDSNIFQETWQKLEDSGLYEDDSAIAAAYFPLILSAIEEQLDSPVYGEKIAYEIVFVSRGKDKIPKWYDLEEMEKDLNYFDEFYFTREFLGTGV